MSIDVKSLLAITSCLLLNPFTVNANTNSEIDRLVVNAKATMAKRNKQKQQLENHFLRRLIPKQTQQDKPEDTQPTASKKLIGFSERKTHFSWGNKTPGYRYLDVEFSYNAAKTAHATKLIDRIKGLYAQSWHVDYSKSVKQAINDQHTAAYTLTQIRFRQRR